MVGAPAYKLLASLSAPKDPGELTYKEVVDKLAAHFRPKPIIIAERFRFYKRAQQNGEKMADYLRELRRLAATCDFKEFLEEALRDRFVCGIKNEAVQRRLLMESELTLNKAVEMAQSMEAAAQDAKEIQLKDGPRRLLLSGDLSWRVPGVWELGMLLKRVVLRTLGVINAEELATSREHVGESRFPSKLIQDRRNVPQGGDNLKELIKSMKEIMSRYKKPSIFSQSTQWDPQYPKFLWRSMVYH